MDSKKHDGFDDDFDIQSLLDKYLPEESADAKAGQGGKDGGAEGGGDE